MVQQTQQEVRRFVGVASTVAGLICYALSSSFNNLFGKWSLFKIFAYLVSSSIICLAVLFPKAWRHLRILHRYRAHFAFLVLISTTVYSFYLDRKSKTKPDAYGLISSAAFAATSLCMSKQIECGFLDLMYFFCGLLVIQLMEIKPLLVFVGIGFAYFLVILRSYVDDPPNGSQSQPPQVVIDMASLPQSSALDARPQEEEEEEGSNQNQAAPPPPQVGNDMIPLLQSSALDARPQEEEAGGRGGAKVNTWVESMRASSPTRVKSNNTLSSENQDKNPWILYHPSALSMFDEIICNSKGKQIVTFLNYDGTLSPIVADPDRAFMSEMMRKTVKEIAKHFPTAIVSGRCIDKLYQFVRLGELYYAGSHGMDIKGPIKSRSHKKDNGAALFQAASQFLPMIDEVYKILGEKVKSVPGAKVENNKFCLSVHFRCVDEKHWPALAEQVKSVLNGYPKLRLTQGRKVLEICPTIKWDKGKAIEFLIESLGYANSNNVFPIYIGDDRTDEDAFKVLRSRGQGIGILVSQIPKETDASYTLQDPAEVGQFLRRLAKWKKAGS